MNSTTYNPRTIGAYAVAIIGTFLIMALMVSFVRQYTQPPPINQARNEERTKAASEIKAADADAFENYAWIDQSKGFVRLPINVAMQIAVQEWQKPAAARAKMIALAEKVSGPAPGGSPQGAPAPGAQPTAPQTPGAPAPAGAGAATPPGSK